MIDTYEKLDIGFDKVKCVVHLADVHIRLTKRHNEYREAFEKVYDGLRKTPTNTLILNLGDVFHSKVDLSPEAIQLASEFLKNCADIRPTIVIAGNHDCLLTNSSRMDSLSPIVNNLNHSKLFYLKESKLYGAGNILFNNMSVFDDPTKYLNIKTVVKSISNQFDCKVALFHGPVHEAMTDIGYQISNRTIVPSIFDGHDIAMLGDIHLIQDIQEYNPAEEKPIIHYAGSMLQQNHGEFLQGHGYTVWNIDARKYIHIEVPNDYGYYTIDIRDGKLITDIKDMPAKPKLRIRCDKTVPTEVKRVVTEIRKSYDITDLVFIRVDSDDVKKQFNNKNSANLTKITNVDYQNELIIKFLKDKYTTIDQATIDAVVDINKTLNEGLNKDDQSKNIRWKPKKFEFSNMFSYGENNVIDFTKLTDVYGLFAANASGKSSLMDALSFCIYDKSARAYKASLVMNSEKMSFECKFNFEINGIDYFIERSGSRDKKGNVAVKVNFYKIENDEQIPLNAEARRSTNELIRDYLGTYDDFILTTLALQGNGGSFIDLGQSERKELLSQFIGLNIFDKLALIASDRVKEVGAAVRAYNKEDNTKRSADMALENESLSAKISEEKTNIDNLKSEISRDLVDISDETAKIISLDNVPTNVDDYIEEKLQLENKISATSEEIEALKTEVIDLKVLHQQDKEALESLNIHKLDEKYSEFVSLSNNVQQKERELDALKTFVREKIKKLEHLDEHQYDPNCRFCMDNVFVKDAKATRGSLTADKETATLLKGDIETSKNALKNYDRFLEMKHKRDELSKKLPVSTNTISRKELKISSLTNDLNSFTVKHRTLVEGIELYEKSKEVVEDNKKHLLVVKQYKQTLSNNSVKLKNLEDQYLKDFARKTSITDQIQTIKTRIEEIELLENEFVAFEYYSQSIGSNGIPYQIISDVIPQIEAEVNNILTQIVEFGMSIETDGRNVNVYINYEDKKWPLELCSGMEKFMAALALRVALINISNLPRPNFMVVDEGFSALDASNFPMVHALFDFMKKNFDFIIVISHLDAMRDMVDKQLEITKENGFSKVDNTK